MANWRVVSWASPMQYLCHHVKILLVHFLANRKFVLSTFLLLYIIENVIVVDHDRRRQMLLHGWMLCHIHKMSWFIFSWISSTRYKFSFFYVGLKLHTMYFLYIFALTITGISALSNEWRRSTLYQQLKLFCLHSAATRKTS